MMNAEGRLTKEDIQEFLRTASDSKDASKKIEEFKAKMTPEQKAEAQRVLAELAEKPSKQ